MVIFTKVTENRSLLDFVPFFYSLFSFASPYVSFAVSLNFFFATFGVDVFCLSYSRQRNSDVI